MLCGAGRVTGSGGWRGACGGPCGSRESGSPPARPAEFVGTGSYGRNVNRTDRLYALVEELRACAPRRRSARELASLYEVSARTIERDIGALQQAGVPIYADAGRSGGYTVDKSLTLPPLNFSPAEAVALAVALGRVSVGPFEGAARSAVRKIVAAMSEPNVIAARDLARRVRLLEPAAVPETVAVPSVIEQAIVARRVLRICYLDRDGNLTERDVEPIVFMAGPGGWYLVGWCRVRGAARCFRVDRIQQAEVTGVTAPPRAFEEIAPCTRTSSPARPSCSARCAVRALWRAFCSARKHRQGGVATGADARRRRDRTTLEER